MTISKILKGDWSDIVRDPIDLVRGVFLIGTVYAIYIGNFDWLIKIGLGALALIIARFLDVPRWLDIGFAVGVALQVGGNLWGLFEHIRYYDKVVHSLFPVFGGPMLYVLFARWGIFQDHIDQQHKHWKLRIFLIVSFFGIVAATSWEMIEFLIDLNVPQSIQQNNTDTITDLMVSTVGSLVGGAVTAAMVAWKTPTLKREKLN